MRTMAMALVAAFVSLTAFGQGLTQPPSGDNQKSAVIQHIGPVQVRIDYSSPDVHAPSGDDRRGKIWGKLVPYGFIDEPFGTCTQCPWRAGANENTVFMVSHDVLVEGQPLRAGAYGLHMVAGPEEWTVIFSNNSTSWGSYTYDPAEDALRVKVKPSKAEYNEWLTYEFIDRKPDRATVALKWEDIQVPFTITVANISEVYLTQIRGELRGMPGFQWQNWVSAARYALNSKRTDDALAFAQTAARPGFPGQENFQTLSVLADAQEAKGLTDAKVTREKALNHATATAAQLHQYARQQLQKGNKDEAIRVWELNAKRYPNQWPVNVGLMRAYSAAGKYKQALKYAKMALPQAPDDVNKKSLEDSIKKLEEGKDINS